MTSMTVTHEGSTQVQMPNLPTHDAQALTQGGNQAFITLNDQMYHLRITRAGKLILTK